MKIYRFIYQFLLSGIFFFNLSAEAFADTSISGYIESNTIWALADSPYAITGNTLIISSATLIIEPGVTIKFEKGYSLQIDGELIARGNPDQMITFTSNQSPVTVGDWGYLFFSDTSKDVIYDGDGNYSGGCILEYCHIEFGGGADLENNGVVRMNNAHPLVKRCRIQNNAASGIYAWDLSSTLTITDCHIKNNIAVSDGAGIYAGIAANDATVEIINCTISNNQGTKGGGVYIMGDRLFTSHAKILGNTITNNTGSGKGGGITIFKTITEITDNLIAGNQGVREGGGLHAELGSTTITKNHITGNVVIDYPGRGGGISTLCNAVVSNNIVSHNTASGDGGGIYVKGGQWTVCSVGCVGYNAHSLEISNNIVLDNQSSGSGGGIWAVKSSLDDTASFNIRGNTVSGNTITGGNEFGAGVYAGNITTGSFTANRITMNKAPLEGLKSSGVHISLSDIPLQGNIIYDNPGYDLFCYTPEGKPSVNAENNWWGTTSENEIREKIYDWSDDVTRTHVDYDPFLNGPDTMAPISPPVDIATVIEGNDILLSWAGNPEPDIAGYRIYYDDDAGFPYDNVVDAGNVTTYSLSGLDGGTYFAVTAYDNGIAPPGTADNPDTIVNENQTRGNESWFSTEILVDQPEVSINGKTAFTGSVNVTLSLAFSNPDGVIAYLASEDPTTPLENDSHWVTISHIMDYSDDVFFTLSNGDGQKIVHVWFKSGTGSISLSNSDAIILDTIAPEGSLLVNNDDAFTTSTDVILNLNASDSEGVTAYYASEDSTPPLAGDSGWSPITSSHNFSADIAFSISLEVGDGSKIVYVWYKDNAGNISLTIMDTIILDTGPPEGSIAVNGNGRATHSILASLEITAFDAGTGGIQMAFSNDGENFSPWENYRTDGDWTLASGDGLKAVYARFRDLAGFQSLIYTDEIFLDGEPPLPFITLPEDGSYVTSILAIAGTAADSSPSSGIAGIELQVTDGSVFLRPNHTWGAEPVFFTPDGGSFSAWNHDTNTVEWVVGTTYTITARVSDFAGNSETRSVSATYGIKKEPSTITCELSENSIILGESLRVEGRITPAPGSGGAFVDVALTSPSGLSTHTSIIANALGNFSHDIKCSDIYCGGKWSVQTSWAGDTDFNGATGKDQTLDVLKAETRITLDVTSKAIKLGESVSISGKFTPQPDCGRDLANLPVTLIVSGPYETDVREVRTNDRWGHFVLADYNGFNTLGDWKIQAVFPGNDAYLASSSDFISLKAVETAGYAIVVQGRIPGEEGLDSHNKTTNFVYGQLKGRGLLDDDIQYFNYNINLTGVTGLPAKTSIQEAITLRALDKMNTKPANLYIIMVDHGLDDLFYMGSDTIGAGELDTWLDTLQDGLEGQAAEQEIIIILGFCRSGSFVNHLSANHRVIIASAAAGESSYKGPLDEDGIRDGEYFISEFFKGVSSGKSIKECFQKAVVLTEQFTSSGAKNANSATAPYYDNALQHPLLDDNGDGKGSNDLFESGGDGSLSKDLFIGVSSVTGNDAGDVTVTRVTQTLFLEALETSTGLYADVDDNTRLRTIWVEVKPPGYAPLDPGGSGQAEMDLTKTVGVWNNKNSRYEWENLEGFTDPGTYQVFYFAKDDISGNISPLMETRVYKALKSNTPPEPFNLLLPQDNAQVLTELMLDWEDTKDPQGDRMTYTVLLSKGDDTFKDSIRIEGLVYSACLLDRSLGIEDLSRYYWKVQAIDEYGAVRSAPESGARVFNTNNTNPVFPGWIKGLIYDAASGTPLSHGIVSLGGLSLTAALGGYYLGNVQAGTYEITASADGYIPKCYSNIHISSLGQVTKNFALNAVPTLIKGDLHRDGTIDLHDVKLGLKVITLSENMASALEDVDGDGKIGLKDTLRIIQHVKEKSGD